LGFCDPSTSDSNPGWPLRNLLILAAKEWYVRVLMEGEISYI